MRFLWKTFTVRVVAVLLLFGLMISAFCGCESLALPQNQPSSEPAEQADQSEQRPTDEYRLVTEYYVISDGHPSEIISYKYNHRGLLQSKTTWTFQNNYGFNDYESDTTSYSYDVAGNLVQVITGYGDETNYKYDAAGNMTAEYSGTSLSKKNSYDERGNCIRSESFRNGSSYETNSEVTLYEYDDQGRVTYYHIEGTDEVYGTYAYDASGNLMQEFSKYGEMESTITYRYDEHNRVIEETVESYLPKKVITYQYDQAGNLIEKKEDSCMPYTVFYTYDEYGNLIKVSSTASDSVKYYTYEKVSTETTDDSWKKIYLNYLTTKFDNTSEENTFYLFDVNSDGVPEMFINLQIYADSNRLISIKDNAIEEMIMAGSSTLSFVPEQGVMLYSGGFQGVFGDTIYEFRDGVFVKGPSGSWNSYTNQYQWERETVSETEYEERLNALFDKDLSVQLGTVLIKDSGEFRISSPGLSREQILSILR